MNNLKKKLLIIIQRIICILLTGIFFLWQYLEILKWHIVDQNLLLATDIDSHYILFVTFY